MSVETRGRAAGNAWLVRQTIRPGAAVRLFCFPHAGGNAWAYRNWASLLPEAVEVSAVQLPGHGHRLRETPIAEAGELLRRAAAALSGEVDQPFAFFGHSLGALVAFEVARRLERETGRSPLHVFVSGHNAPHLPESTDGLSRLDDRELIEQLRALGSSPPALLEHEELMALMLPVIRADFGLCENYHYEDGPPLACGLTALGGRGDRWTDAAGLEAWRRHAAGPFGVRLFDGDHFFVSSDERAVVSTVAETLAMIGALAEYDARGRRAFWRAT